MTSPCHLKIRIINIGLKQLLKEIIQLNLEKKLEQKILKKYGMETKKKKN